MEQLVRTSEAYRDLLTLIVKTSLEDDIVQGGITTLTALLQARYGAIGIFDENGRLAQFLYAGMDKEQAAEIGRRPEGRGMLGIRLEPDRVVRVSNISRDPQAGGFPPHHPIMQSLLLCPISHEQQIYGKIYLCDKTDGSEFTEDDELLVLSFAHSLGLVIAYTRAAEERRKALEWQATVEARLRQNQKMEALGRLAGGIAHDFNNILTAIIGNCEMGDLRIRNNEDTKRYFAEIRMASQRAASLVSQLLAFSRRQEIAPQVLDVNQVISNLLPMIRCLMGDDVALDVSQDPHVGKVKIDQGQIERVFINLIVNARDAMPTGGKLYIETFSRELTALDAQGSVLKRPGPYVGISMRDTGCGMSEEIRSRIFEPFFTTKESGQGTGLGLSTVYGIVAHSGGTISVTSAPGEGATFTILLPRCEGGEQEEQVESPLATEDGSGSETILLVEDNDTVRRSIREMLENKGYHVLEAPDGETALTIFHSCQGAIHLVLTDVMMPNMSGFDLVRHIQALHPAPKVLCMSGYPVFEHGQAAKFFEQGQDNPESYPSILKPFSSGELTKKIRDVLQQS